jgi:glycosyltransferase involved in cell wall biosynthesis
MRIFQVCADPGVPFDGTKGASVHLRALSDAFRHQGHELRMFVANRGIPPPTGGGSFSVHRLEKDSLKLATDRWGRPDFVYERYALGHADGLLSARRLAVPFALEVNAPLVDEASRYRPAVVREGDEEIERMLFRHADVVAAVSEPLRQYVAGIRGTSRGTLVVRNCCDPATFVSDASLGGDGSQTLVFLGHPKPWHGAEQLPRLLVELVRRGRDPRLLLIGGGAWAKRVVIRAEREGVAGRIEVTGSLPHEDAVRRLGEGTVAVAPYPPHPFFYFSPLKLVECMAAGLPIVTTSQGDIPEIVGDAAALVPPGDLMAMADAVERLLDHEPLRMELGAAARERAMSQFAWDRAASQIVAAVNETSAGREWAA